MLRYYLIFASMKETLPNWIVDCLECSWGGLCMFQAWEIKKRCCWSTCQFQICATSNVTIASRLLSMPCAILKHHDWVTIVSITVLCKNSESKVCRISSFVLTKVDWHFTWMPVNFRWLTRNFKELFAKFCPPKRNFGKMKWNTQAWEVALTISVQFATVFSLLQFRGNENRSIHLHFDSFLLIWSYSDFTCNVFCVNVTNNVKQRLPKSQFKNSSW